MVDAPRASRAWAMAKPLPSSPSRFVRGTAGAGELDDDGAHLRVLRPGRVRDVGRPDGRFTRRDARPLLTDADPAATLDHDEVGRVGIGVWLDPSLAREDHFGDRSTTIRVDRLATQTHRADRTVRPSMPDAEPPDLDGQKLDA